MVDNSVHFTLSDDTKVEVKKVMEDKYDFALKLPNGTRKTFFWLKDSVTEFSDRKGRKDKLITEAIRLFREMLLVNQQSSSI
jgi:hypothetical protein